MKGLESRLCDQTLKIERQSPNPYDRERIGVPRICVRYAKYLEQSQIDDCLLGKNGGTDSWNNVRRVMTHRVQDV